MRNDNSPFNRSGSPGAPVAQPGTVPAGQANQNQQKLHLVSRNLTVNGRRTSVRLEPDMWAGYAEICRREGLSLHQLSDRISEKIAPYQSLTSAIRVFIMVYFRSASTEEGHAKAGHPSHKVGY